MADISEQIAAIEKEIRETPYHKATEHHIGRLRAKLAKLRDREMEQGTRKGGGGGGYAVKKEGDATVVLVGHPSVGKSTLLNVLTNAKSKTAPYAFTTVSVIPGMMVYKDTYIQIMDVPGLIEGAEEGKGRGREVLSVARAADLLLIMTDIARRDSIEKIVKILTRNGIRINQEKPGVLIEKKTAGGIIIHSNIKQEVSKEVVKEVAQEFSIRNAEITLKEKLSLDRLIDAFSTNRAYLPAMFCINKIDLSATKEPSDADTFFISAQRGLGLEELKEKIWQRLGFIRVYLVREAQEPSFENPMVMKEGSSLREVAEKIGTEFAEGKKGARIWGTGARFAGQEVSLSTKVQEGMQVRFI